MKKIAEQRSGVSPLSKKIVAPSCQSSDEWMFEKTIKCSVGEIRGYSVTTRKASFKTLYINQVRALPEQMRLQHWAIEYTKNKSVSDVWAPAPALGPQVISATGHKKKFFYAMPNGGYKFQ